MVILAMFGLSPINAAEIYSMIRRREFIAGLGSAAVLVQNAIPSRLL
jgi:hypothetical protein